MAIAGICLLLAPITPAEFRRVNEVMAGLALFWAAAIGVEDIVRVREYRQRDRD